MASMQQFMTQTLSLRPLEPIALDEPISIDALPTPALVIDLDAFEQNLDKMQAHLESNGLGLRCHTKMHKSPTVAWKQIDRGALGVCCATVSEAEVMQAAGIAEILITSPIVTPDKAARVIALAAGNPGLQIVVDSTAGADLLDRHAADAGCTLRVLIDLDPGMGRTGIAPGEPALALGRHIREHCPRLKFSGLQMYAGNCMHILDYGKRRDKYFHLMQKGIDTKQAFEAAGIPVPVFTGGGTGTWDMEPELGALTDLQAGSYAFMDMEYRDIASKNGPRFDDFIPSLTLLVTAISKPQERLITVDAGFKSLASDKEAPEFRDVEGVTWHWGGDEHGIISLDNPSRTLSLGDRLHVITPHCDPTVNLHDWYFPHRDGVVSEIWPISARGCSQ